MKATIITTALLAITSVTSVASAQWGFTVGGGGLRNRMQRMANAANSMMNGQSRIGGVAIGPFTPSGTTTGGSGWVPSNTVINGGSSAGNVNSITGGQNSSPFITIGGGQNSNPFITIGGGQTGGGQTGGGQTGGGQTGGGGDPFQRQQAVPQVDLTAVKISNTSQQTLTVYLRWNQGPTKPLVIPAGQTVVDWISGHNQQAELGYFANLQQQGQSAATLPLTGSNVSLSRAPVNSDVQRTAQLQARSGWMNATN